MTDPFRHEALFYGGDAAFVSVTAPFLRQALANGEAALAVVSQAKIEALRDELGREAEQLQFADMGEAGTNPATIIPLWQRFVEEHGRPGLQLLGIGEPIWVGRSAAELVECQRHERLLNLAFAGNPAFRLLCPYDATALDESVIEEAKHSHPYLGDGGAEHLSHCYSGIPLPSAGHSDPLPPAPLDAEVRVFDEGSVAAARKFVAARALAAQLGPRAAELVLAVNEIVTNSVLHGGGGGVLKMWQEGEWLVCEVSDSGRIAWAMAGRVAPPTDGEGGRGLWMANQLCDLVQIRTFPGGNVVRLHLRRRSSATSSWKAQRPCLPHGGVIGAEPAR